MKVKIGVVKYVEEEIEMEETEEMRFLRALDYYNASDEERDKHHDTVDKFYDELVNKNLITGEICCLYLDDTFVAEW